MTKIANLPATSIILGFRGVIDYFCWKGMYLARSWPQKPRQPRSPAVKAQYAPFAFISQQATTIDLSTRTAYESMAWQTERTFRDYQIDLFYGKDVDISTT